MSASIWAPGAELVVVDAESTNLSQVFTASAGQLVFNLTEYTYTPNTGSIAVYRGGQKLVLGIDYTETSSSAITLTGITLAAGETVEIVAIIGSASAFAGQSEAALLEFRDAFLGAFAVAPTVDLQGNPLSPGQLYWNTVTNVMYGWSGTEWKSTFTDLTPDHIDFPNTITAIQEARLQWNNTDGTLDLGLKGGNVTLQIGQEQLVRVLNNTGSALTDMQVVRITGASGQRLTASLAQANAESTSATTFAIVTEPIANNQQGFATVSGLVRNVNTSAFAEGAALYLSPTVAGGITAVKPTAPNHSVLIGWCVVSNATTGSIFVNVSNGYELDELHDVKITSPAANHLLQWNAAGYWENVVDATIAGNINLTGSGKRITGDFTNATVANRVMFQTSTVNGNTSVGLIPNGTAQTAFLTLHNSSDPNNSSVLEISNQRLSGEARVAATITGTGTYLPMTFYTGGSERMRIDTSGNVGIGKNNPSKKLVVSDGTVDGMFHPVGANGLCYIGTSNNYGVAFNVNDSERMRIDSSGNLLVGTTSNTENARLFVRYPYPASGGAAPIGTEVDSTLSLRAIAFRNPNGLVGTIATSGSGTAYNTSSDYRLKENIQPMQNALAVVQQLNPVTYTWKADGSDGQGFIAHELQAVVPDCVTGEKDATRIEKVEVTPAVAATFDEDGNELTPAVEAVFEEREVPVYQGIDTSFLVATLTAAIQEQQTIITSLESRILALEAK